MDVKYKVLRGFRDKQTKKTYKKGDAFTGEKERVDEINAQGKDKPFLEPDTAKPTDTAKPAGNTKTSKNPFGGILNRKDDE